MATAHEALLCGWRARQAASINQSIDQSIAWIPQSQSLVRRSGKKEPDRELLFSDTEGYPRIVWLFGAMSDYLPMLYTFIRLLPRQGQGVSSVTFPLRRTAWTPIRLLAWEDCGGVGDALWEVGSRGRKGEVHWRAGMRKGGEYLPSQG